MSVELRLGTRSLAWGVFYHWQKRILYLHPVPGIGLVIHRTAPPPVMAPAGDDHLCWGPTERKVGDAWACPTCGTQWTCVLHSDGGTIWLHDSNQGTAP